MMPFPTCPRFLPRLLVALLTLASLGCASQEGPGSLEFQRKELRIISSRLSAGRDRITSAYQQVEEDLAELEADHGTIAPSDKPRIRKLLLECFNVSSEVAVTGNEPCATLSSYTLDGLKRERSGLFAAVVDERLLRTASLRQNLKRLIPAEAERMAREFVTSRARVRELRSVADAVYATAQHYDTEELVDLNEDYQAIVKELQAAEEELAQLEQDLNQAPGRLRDLLYRALQLITN